MYSYGPPHGRAKAGQPARTYIQQLYEDTGCSSEDLPEAMNDREEWRERGRDIRAGGTTWWWWCSTGMAKSTWCWVLFILLITTWSCFLAGIGWCIYISKIQENLFLSFSWTDSGLFLQHGQNFCLLSNSQGITFPSLFLFFFFFLLLLLLLLLKWIATTTTTTLCEFYPVMLIIIIFTH